MKRRLTVLFALLICLVGSVQAQLSKTVELTEAGTLEAQLGEDVGKITELIVKGPLNEADFVTMKEKMKSIQVLDMGGVTELPFENRRVGETRVPFSVIPSSAFEGKLTLRKVVFPPVVEIISRDAFRGCSNLVEVDFSLAGNLKRIDKSVFLACNNIKKLDLSNCRELECIEMNSFCACANLQSVDLTGCEKLEEIGSNCFDNCYSLNEVTLSGCSSLKRINSEAFFRNNNLSSFDFALLPMLEDIGSYAFSQTNISGRVILGRNITKIGSFAFWECQNISSVDFSNCSNLVVIENGVFSGCNVKSVDLTNCPLLNTLSMDAFGKSLEEYVIDNGFYKSIDGVLFNAETNTLLNYPSGKKNESYEVPSSVVSINDNAFDGNSNLKKLVIPSSVKSIGCQDLGFLKLYMQSPTPIALSGEISNEGERMPIYVPKGSGEAYRNASIWKNYVIIEEDADPITITLNSPGTLREEIVSKNLSLTEFQDLIIVGPVNANDFSTIKAMKLIRKVDLSSAELFGDELSDGAFARWNNDEYSFLEEVILPEGLKGIGKQAFRYNSVIKKVVMPVSLVDIQEHAFEECSNLEEFDFSKLINLKTIEYAAFFKCSAVPSHLILPNSLEGIGAYAFNGTAVTQVDLSNTRINFIAYYAFEKCNIVGQLSFPSTLHSIGEKAFFSANLESIKLKDFVSLSNIDVFASTNLSKSILYVPKGSKTRYLSDDGWSKFKNIEEYGNSISLIFDDSYQSGAFGGGTYEIGEKVVLKADPYKDTSWYNWACLFDGWYENGQLLSSDSVYSFTMEDSDRLIDVRYIGIHFFCNEGNIDRISQNSKNVKVLFTKPQGDDWVFLGWYEGSTCLSKDFELTIEAGKENRTIEARCSTKQMDIHGNEVVITDNEKIEGAEVQFYGKYMTIEGEKAWNMKRFVYRHPRSIVVDSDVKAEEIEFLLESLGNEWSFISLPYNCKVSELAQNNPDVQFVVREYDGKSRANNGIGTSWKQLAQADEMQANKGYILRADRYQTFDLSSSDVSGMNTLFNRKEVTIPLNTYSSASVLDANWNLLGNPYPAYYRLEQLYADGLDATVTVWSPEINNYEYYTADDKDVFLKPYTAFFVQKNTSNLKFVPEGRVAVPDTTNNLRSAGDRQIINLVLANESSSDRTRIVFNEAASLEYELGKDAAKFASMKAGSPSLYSFDGQNHSLAINERPKADGIVRLGVAITEKGTYTLSLKEAIATDLKLVDKVTGSVCDLATSNYEFEAEVGTYNDRFELRSGVATANEMIDSSVRCVIRDGQLIINGLPERAILSVYDAAGKNYYQGKVTNGEIRLGNLARGIYYLQVVTLDGKQIIRSIKW